MKKLKNLKMYIFLVAINQIFIKLENLKMLNKEENNYKLLMLILLLYTILDQLLMIIY